MLLMQLSARLARDTGTLWEVVEAETKVTVELSYHFRVEQVDLSNDRSKWEI